MTDNLNHDIWDSKDLSRYLLSRKKIVLNISSAGIILSILISLLIPNTYTASAYIIGAEDDSSSQVNGGFASSLSSIGLGNITVGNKGSVNVDKARLKSREFLTSFIEKHDLLPILFSEKWDPEARSWTSKKIPSLIDGYESLESRISIFGPTPLNEIISVSVDWYDPVLASNWTNMLIEELNLDSRNRKREEVNQSLFFIQKELQKANLAEIKFSLNELTKSQLRDSILTNVKVEYSFRFIDHAIPPTKKSAPNRAIIVIIATIMSFALVILYLLFDIIFFKKKKLVLFS
jgi:uncharacterized protein involved in exopolysaccharide biosynthesis